MYFLTTEEAQRNVCSLKWEMFSSVSKLVFSVAKMSSRSEAEVLLQNAPCVAEAQSRVLMIEECIQRKPVIVDSSALGKDGFPVTRYEM